MLVVLRKLQVVRSHEGLIWILDRISGFKKTSLVHEEVENDNSDKVCEQVAVLIDARVDMWK